MARYGLSILVICRYLTMTLARCHGAPAQSDSPRPLLFVAYKLESAHLPGSKFGNYPPKNGVSKGAKALIVEPLRGEFTTDL